MIGDGTSHSLSRVIVGGVHCPFRFEVTEYLFPRRVFYIRHKEQYGVGELGSFKVAQEGQFCSSESFIQEDILPRMADAKL